MKNILRTETEVFKNNHRSQTENLPKLKCTYN